MSPEPRAHRALHAFRARWPALAGAALLGACALPPPATPAAVSSASVAPLPVLVPVPAPAPATRPAPAAALAMPTEPAVSMPVQGNLPGAARPDQGSASIVMLGYAERLRRLQPPELAQELARLSEALDGMRQPGDDLQLALALAQTRAPSDLARAQALVARVLGNSRDEARGLHPLAGLLAARFAEQRRVEELLAQQAQQLREQQRRIDQLNERLEAVRAIERSLTSRPAPANGTHRPQQP